MVMDTIYNQNISNKLTSDYLCILVNKVFALLPMFEESFISEDKNVLFQTYQHNLLQTVNGNLQLLHYNNPLVLDILSNLQSLLTIVNHDDYRRHVLKICKLLTLLKKEVDKNGL